MELARIIRFGIVGVLATAVHVGTVMLLVENRWLPDPLMANVVAFSCAVLVSFFGHSRWTFGQRRQDLPQFLRFLATTLLALGLNQLIMGVSTRMLGLDYRLAMALIVVLVPLFTYALARSWVFTASRCGVASAGKPQVSRTR